MTGPTIETGYGTIDARPMLETGYGAIDNSPRIETGYGPALDATPMIETGYGPPIPKALPLKSDFGPTMPSIQPMPSIPEMPSIQPMPSLDVFKGTPQLDFINPIIPEYEPPRKLEFPTTYNTAPQFQEPVRSIEPAPFLRDVSSLLRLEPRTDFSNLIPKSRPISSYYTPPEPIRPIVPDVKPIEPIQPTPNFLDPIKLQRTYADVAPYVPERTNSNSFSLRRISTDISPVFPDPNTVAHRFDPSNLIKPYVDVAPFIPDPVPFKPIETFKPIESLKYTQPIVPEIKIEPIGKPWNLPSAWEPVKNFGLNGPGEARTVFPGLIERRRPMHEHGNYGLHRHDQELYGVFTGTKPLTRARHIFENDPNF